MSLDARITALAVAIAADIKHLGAAVGSLPQDHILAGTTATIGAGRQMPIYGAIRIDGALEIQGKLVLT